LSTNAWVVALTGVAADGNVTQLYPVSCSAGVAKASSTIGQLLRRPMEGALHSVQVRADGANAGVIEVYDVNGEDAGADVSSATTITDTQLDALITAGRARLIFVQDVPMTAGTGVINAPGLYRAFAKGLAARYVSAGACTLNLVVTGGCRKTESRGGY
jgi:hypothetical protein